MNYGNVLVFHLGSPHIGGFAGKIGFRTRDNHNTTALYVGALPTRLSPATMPFRFNIVSLYYNID